MTTVLLVTAFFALGVGTAVIWANPARFPNKIFLLTSLLLFLALIFTYAGFRTGTFVGAELNPSWVSWMRARGAVAALLPWALWMLKESFIANEREKARIVLRSLPWIMIGILAGWMNFSKLYISADPSSTSLILGPIFILRNGIIMLMFAVLVNQSRIQIRNQCGIRRIEMQFFVLNLGISAFLSFGLSFLGALLNKAIFLKPLSILIVFSGYALSAWAIAFYRVFDLRHVLLSLTQRLGLLVFLGLGVIFATECIEAFLSPLTALFLSIAICGSIALWADRKSRDWLDLGGELILSNIRRAIIQIALKEHNLNELISNFESLLQESAQTTLTKLLFSNEGNFRASGLTFSKRRPGYVALCEAGWVTPESLERRRKTLQSDDLQQFIAQNKLGLIVASPAGSRNPSILIVFSAKTESWPFTYPEVRRLQNVAELMDSILTRSRLTTQAALTAKMEHLAMMSRGLAHDLKNLITPVSSFLIHTDNHFSSGSPEAEVHSAARRSVRIMTDYVREALFFSERLAPNFETVDLSKLFQTVSEITASRAARRGITVSFAGELQASLVADAVLLQRMLGNLVSNAIDASSRGQKIAVSISKTDSGKARFQVKDEGAGIAPEHLSRIFDPYFTTKEFGEDVRGFGLGLTICQKIAELHGGTISVHSQVQRGTTVSVDLPPAPSSVPRNEPVLGEGLSSLHPNLSR